MENKENILGGGPLSPADEQAMSKGVDRMVEHIEGLGVQETPTSPSAPIQIDRADLLEYKLLGSRASYAELQVTMYTRELQRSQAEAATITHEGRTFVKALEQKYNVDLSSNMITEDGYLMPRPTDERMKLLQRG
jgi:hypothetical protein